MKLYTKGMIGKKYKINYKQIDEWMAKVREEWGSIRRSGYVSIKDDPYGRFGVPEYLVEAYPDVVPQPVLYIVQSVRSADVEFFMQRINSKLNITHIPINTDSAISRERSIYTVYEELEKGKSVAVIGNGLLAEYVRELVLGAINRGAREMIIQIKGHWEPEPYNVIEFDTAGDDEVFLAELKNKIKSLVI